MHLAVLSSFALAQPLLDILGKNATFFVVRGSSGREIVLFALALTILPPVLLGLAVLGADAIDPFLGHALHLVFVAALTAAVALRALKGIGSSAGALLLVAALVGLGGAALYRRTRAFQQFLTLLAPAPLIFLGLFLGGSDISRLAFGDEPQVRTVDTQSRTPVVLIVLDEFSTVALMDRNERIDAKRFPHFAALAADATWHRTATSVHFHTDQAVSAVLTGRLPPVPHRLPTFADHPRNVFTLFGGDYRLRAFEAITSLCPRSLCTGASSPVIAEDSTKAVPGGTDVLFSDLAVVYLHAVLPKELAARVPPIGDSWGDFRGLRDGGRTQAPRGPTPAAAGSCGGLFCPLTQAISPDARPTLYFLHLLLPHAPWTHLPSGKRYAATNVREFPGLHEASWGHDQWLALQAYQRYLLQVGYTDRGLGIVMARLRSAGLYDRAVVVVTADHGVSFRLGEPRRNLTRANFPDIALVPLLVKAPGQKRGRIVDDLARTIDVLPTIADAANARLPWQLDGHSLLGRSAGSDGEITIADLDGAPITARLSTLVSERRLALDRQISVFGTGAFAGVYRIGPHHELLGRRTADLRVEQRRDVRFVLDGAELLRSVDPDSEVLPTYITGKIVGDIGERVPLAVGVNGSVTAMTRTYEDDGETRFAALIPRRSLRAGSNDVEIFAIRLQTGSFVLAQLRGGNATFVLSGRSGREVIQSSEGQAVRVVPGALLGSVRAVTPGGNVIFTGSALDANTDAQADSVVVFVDGHSIYVSPAANVKRRGIERAGFRFELPDRLLPEPGKARRIRLFAIRGNTASELRYTGFYLTVGRH